MGAIRRFCDWLMETLFPVEVESTPGRKPTIPATVVGHRLHAAARTEATADYWDAEADKGHAILKIWQDILPTDWCQRGPDGAPLARVTPLVPFQTLAEWEEIGRQLNEQGTKTCEN